MAFLLWVYTMGIAAVLSEQSTQSWNSSNISVPKQNEHHKIADVNEDKHFVDNVFHMKLETSGARVKRRIHEECLKGDQPETKDRRCPPPGKYPQLVEYRCCVDCRDLETQSKCEPYSCTEIHACSASPLRVPLDLSERNISGLPQDVFNSVPEVTDLDLSHNNIHVLPNNVFSSIPEVTDLDLSHNNIQILPKNVFFSIPEITDLDLSHNRIQVLPSNLFYGLYKLQNISLSGNEFINISSDVFNGLTNLKLLYISSCNVDVLPSNIFNGLSKLKKLDLQENKITELPHNVFRGLYQLTHIHLDKNKISVLQSDLFSGLSNLFHLSLGMNNVSVLLHSVFNDLRELNILNLGFNKISVVPSNVFYRLTKLYQLLLLHNEINVLHYNSFHGLSGLTALNLKGNNIATLPADLFGGLSNIRVLLLNRNNITVVPNNLFRGLHQLVELDLSNNHIQNIPFDLFLGLSALTELHIHHNEISFLPDKVFYKMVGDYEQYLFENLTVSSVNWSRAIEKLDLSYNKLTHLPRLPENLSQLNIARNQLEVTEHMFEGLYNLRNLYTDVPFMCCVRPPTVEEANCGEMHWPLWLCALSAGLCKSKGEAISSCYSLVNSTILKVCLWIIGLCALGGNLAVIMYRLLIDKGNLGKKYSLFTLNLAVSDMLMGIYLLIIGVVDIYYDGKYAWHDHKWRNSSLCTAAGILSSVSSEMSTFLILMVTIDRLIVIMFPLSRLSQGNVTWKWSVFVSVLLWMVSGTLAIIPVIALQSYFKDEFYSQSSVCLVLPLRGNEQPGTEYSFAVFVCLNSFIFLLVLVGQMCICKSLRTSGARISSSQKRRREMTVAWTLFFVVATDFCCWFPIGVMGVASRFGMDIPDTVYAWVMVFVLPINAAINPLLYTGTAIWRNRKKKLLPIIPLTPQQNQPTGDSTTLASVIRQRSSNDK